MEPVGNLDKLEYIFDQTALSEDGEVVESQTLKFRAVDGVHGMFYQITFPGTKSSWSFSEPEDLAVLAEKFKLIAESLTL